MPQPLIFSPNSFSTTTWIHLNNDCSSDRTRTQTKVYSNWHQTIKSPCSTTASMSAATDKALRMSYRIGRAEQAC